MCAVCGNRDVEPPAGYDFRAATVADASRDSNAADIIGPNGAAGRAVAARAAGRTRRGSTGRHPVRHRRLDAGGRDTNTVFTNNGSWSLGPPLPEALDHPAAAVLLGQLYVGGGFSAGRARATVYRFAQDHWDQVASVHHPRAAFALIPLDGRLYAIGGRDTAMASVAIPEVYDPALGTWSDLPALPTPRHRVAGFAYQEMACVAGGKFPYTARVDCIDPTSLTWHRLPDLPQVTSGAGVVMLGGHPVVVGGEGNAVVPWLFSLVGATWQRQEMLLPRHGIEVAILNHRAWVCGGGTVAGLHPTSVCTSIGSAPDK